MAWVSTDGFKSAFIQTSLVDRDLW